MKTQAASSKTAAIFDVDGTLFTGHFWQGIVKHHFEHKVRRSAVSAYLATHYPLWIAYKCKVLSEEAFKIKWGEDLAILMKGFTEEALSEVFQWIDKHYVADLLRPDIMKVLEHHRHQGHTTILLSASYTDFLEVIKTRLGANHVIGTKIKMVNGVCSGKIEGPLCFGENKAKYLQQFVNNEKLDIDLAASFAYTDSATDTPVLHMVGHPVAAYPDKKLLRLAHHSGWQILPAQLT
jgi:HAD superfamily hydrolase (TIGR01490 family)